MIIETVLIDVAAYFLVCGVVFVRCVDEIFCFVSTVIVVTISSFYT